MARIDPLPPSAWTEEMLDAVAAMRPAEPRHPFPPRDGRSKGVNALGTFLHHPTLARSFHTFNGHILFATTLSARQRELVILRVAHLRSSQYEWDQHVLLAHDAEITDDEIARVAAGPDAAGWDPLEAALVRAADELLDDAMVTDDTWAVLADGLDTQQLLDLVFTVGAYDLVAMAFRTFGVVADPPAETPPERS
ncbi:MAG: carboxymuconolactone decarboxylase family protein [Actinobacteria bacterium]|nr:carboxymuconolactone decarboxylase family protein [Actinomycetota bacterium]